MIIPDCLISGGSGGRGTVADTIGAVVVNSVTVVVSVEGTELETTRDIGGIRSIFLVLITVVVVAAFGAFVEDGFGMVVEMISVCVEIADVG